MPVPVSSRDLHMTNKKNNKTIDELICPIFGECGGCQYQDISYCQELDLKQKTLQGLLCGRLKHLKNFSPEHLPLESIVASPRLYHYRNRLDLKLLRTKDLKVFMGFSPINRTKVIETDSCLIAHESISNFLPSLKNEAKDKLPLKYRNANLVVRTGDDGRVFWGGIGRRSLVMKAEDYFWTQLEGKKIFYSLDSFFQANLSILPVLIDKIKNLKILTKDASFYDLYGGVGFFGTSLYDCVKNVVLIEENIYATKLAQHNIRHNKLKKFEIIGGRMEDHLSELPKRPSGKNRIAMIDPPRGGLREGTARFLAKEKNFSQILYLSCNPESLVRDLDVFLEHSWKIGKIIPFDFFPRTKHIETLVLLRL